MKTAASVLQMIVRITGVLQIVLGVVFWTGNAGSLVMVHILSGMILVFALWGLGILSIQARASVPVALVAFVWGLLTIGLGMSQDQIFIGPSHWIVQVLHLLIGIGAIGLSERLGAGILRGQITAARPV
jgi:hypothetical protein